MKTFLNVLAVVVILAIIYFATTWLSKKTEPANIPLDAQEIVNEPDPTPTYSCEGEKCA